MEASEIAHNQGYKVRQWCPWFFFFLRSSPCSEMYERQGRSFYRSRGYALKSRDVGEDFPDQKPKKKKKKLHGSRCTRWVPSRVIITRFWGRNTLATAKNWINRGTSFNLPRFFLSVAATRRKSKSAFLHRLSSLATFGLLTRIRDRRIICVAVLDSTSSLNLRPEARI